MCASRVIPALLTRMSTGPRALAACSKKAVDRRFAPDVAPRRPGPSARRLDGGLDLARRRLAVAKRNPHRGASFRQRLRDRPADASGAAGHDRHTPREAQFIAQRA